MFAFFNTGIVNVSIQNACGDKDTTMINMSCTKCDKSSSSGSLSTKTDSLIGSVDVEIVEANCDDKFYSESTGQKIFHLGDSHHRWVKRWISRPTKCLACMGDLSIYCHSAECYSKHTFEWSCFYSKILIIKWSIKFLSL